MEQPSLFSEQPQSARLSPEEMAAHIALHSKTYESVDRTSDAAREQGWGPVDLPPARESAPHHPPKRRFHPRGPLRGDSELDAGRSGAHEDFIEPNYSEPEIAAARLGMTAARAELNRDKVS